MSDPRREVAAIDLEHHRLLRANVVDHLASAARRFDAPGATILDIAPQDHEGARPHFTLGTVRTLDIDPSSGADYIADLCQDNRAVIPSGSFDVVVCTEVLEHTLNPFDAVAELHRILRPGGVAIVTTPYNFRIHGPLPDCWRFTEHGLRELFKHFAELELGQLDDPERFLMPIQYTLVARR